jgi:hypothetical protein
VDSKDGVDFAMLFILKTTRKAGKLKLLCCQGLAVADYSFNLYALVLKSSGFCNVIYKGKVRTYVMVIIKKLVL